MLFLFGALWAIVGVWLIIEHTAARDLMYFTWGDIFRGMFERAGPDVVAFATGEIVVAILAFRGGDFARFVGMAYALTFGVSSWLILPGESGPYPADQGTAISALLTLCMAGYGYILVVFAIRWRKQT
jgi:hypothetical protein